MIYVYHQTHAAIVAAANAAPRFMTESPARAAALLEEGGHFELVAVVRQDDLEAAWAATQNIDHEWSIEPGQGVAVMKPNVEVDCRARGHRSSMVGDIFQVEGTSYLVANAGFLPIPAAG